MIKVNRPKAESIVMERLREERTPELARLDLEYIRALETASDAAPIIELKQQLRDVTAKDFSGLSLEELAALDLQKALEL